MWPREASAGGLGRFFAELRDVTEKTREVIGTGQEPPWKEACGAPL